MGVVAGWDSCDAIALDNDSAALALRSVFMVAGVVGPWSRGIEAWASVLSSAAFTGHGIQWKTVQQGPP